MASDGYPQGYVSFAHFLLYLNILASSQGSNRCPLGYLLVFVTLRIVLFYILGDRVACMINNLGAMSVLEMNIIAKETLEYLGKSVM